MLSDMRDQKHPSVTKEHSGFVTTLVLLTLLVVATLAMISTHELARAALSAAVYP